MTYIMIGISQCLVSVELLCSETSFPIIFVVIILNFLEVGHFIIIVNLILKQLITVRLSVDISVCRSGQGVYEQQ